MNLRLQIVHSTGLSGKVGAGLSFFLTVVAFKGPGIAFGAVEEPAVVVADGVDVAAEEFADP